MSQTIALYVKMGALLINQEVEETKFLMRWRDAKKHHEVKKTTPPPLATASIALRLKAFIIDSFMLLMPILYIVFYLILGSREGFRTHMLEGWLWVLIPHFSIITLFLLLKGQTPGYKAYDIVLVDKKTLTSVHFTQLCLRYALWLVAIITIVGLFVPLFRKDRSSLYDLLAHTLPLHTTQSLKQ